MIRTVIPSKDRAAQLDLLLRSMQRFVRELSRQTTIVLYRTTTPEYEEAYKVLQKEHPWVVFAREENFRPDMQKLCLSGEEGCLQIGVDDDCYVAPFSLNDIEFKRFLEDEQVIALSLRMSPKMTHCFTENVATPPPWFRTDGAWYWPGLRGDWGYPMSVDLTIWRRCDVRKVIAYGDWKMLHQLEPALRAAMTRPLAICYPEVRIRNNADNTIQDGVDPNRHGGGDPVAMNQRYLAGERIKMDNIIAADPPSPHFLIDYEWEVPE